jgi:hypothetical protein
MTSQVCAPEVRIKILLLSSGKWTLSEVPMPRAQDLIERARMFDDRADRATDPVSRQHYREMAAHYRSLSVEYQEVKIQPDREPAH